MTPTAFRKMALALPDAIESQHMSHPDFRVDGKVFATLFHRAETDYGMVRLSDELQGSLCEQHPGLFEPLAGAWGRQGCTRINLPAVQRVHFPLIREALRDAWEIAAARARKRSKTRK